MGAKKTCESAEDSSRAQVFASAAVVWFAAALVGALPFLAIAWTVAFDPTALSIPASAADPTLRAFRSPVNAWFESMSGFTGSGLTMAREESELPATLLWWRSLSQWLGGLGVIVLTIAIVNQSGENLLHQYYEVETPLGQFQSGDRSNDPSLLVSVFAVVTTLAAALFWIAGMPAWDALNHAMTGLATEGFVVTDTSFKAYGEVVRMAALPVMFVGTIPLPAYYLLFKTDFSAVYSDIQVRWLSLLIIGGTLAVLGTLSTRAIYPSTFAAALGATFQFVSAISCTGFLYRREHRAQMAVGSGTRVNDGHGIRRGLRLDGERHKGHPGDQHHSRGPRTDPGPLPRGGALGLDRRVGLRTTVLGELPQRLAGRLPVNEDLPAGVFALLAVLPIGPGPEAVPVGNVLFTVASAQGTSG